MYFYKVWARYGQKTIFCHQVVEKPLYSMQSRVKTECGHISAKPSGNRTNFFLVKIIYFFTILTITAWPCISKQEKVIPEKPVLGYTGNFCFARNFFLFWVRENLRKVKMWGKNNFYSKSVFIFWNFSGLGEIWPKNQIFGKILDC